MPMLKSGAQSGGIRRLWALPLQPREQALPSLPFFDSATRAFTTTV